MALTATCTASKEADSYAHHHRNLTIQDKYLPGYPQPGAPQPTPLPLTLLTWVYPLLRLPEREIIRVAGLDVAIYLRLLRFGEAAGCTVCLNSSLQRALYTGRLRPLVRLPNMLLIVSFYL
jgi:hypothetical protein